MNDDDDLIRKRQHGRATVMALLLGALVVLIFAISITRIREGMPDGARAATDKGASGSAIRKGPPEGAPVR